MKILLLGVAFLLVGCSSAPTPLQPGAETTPLYGCIEYRTRGGQC